MNRILAIINLGLIFWMASTWSVGCAQLKLHGTFVDKTGLGEARAIAWHSYGRTDRVPNVRIVEGAALTCTVAENGKAGFSCFGQCREGCSILPTEVSVAFDGSPWSAGTLCHEYRHATFIRDALTSGINEGDLTEALRMAQDFDHSRPDWKPGGSVAKCNAALAERGL